MDMNKEDNLLEKLNALRSMHREAVNIIKTPIIRLDQIRTHQEELKRKVMSAFSDIVTDFVNNNRSSIVVEDPEWVVNEVQEELEFSIGTKLSHTEEEILQLLEEYRNRLIRLLRDV